MLGILQWFPIVYGVESKHHKGLWGFGLGPWEQPLLPLFLSTPVSNNNKVFQFLGQMIFSTTAMSVPRVLPFAGSHSYTPDMGCPSSQPLPFKSQPVHSHCFKSQPSCKVLCITRLFRLQVAHILPDWLEPRGVCEVSQLGSYSSFRCNPMRHLPMPFPGCHSKGMFLLPPPHLIFFNLN